MFRFGQEKQSKLVIKLFLVFLFSTATYSKHDKEHFNQI